MGMTAADFYELGQIWKNSIKFKTKLEKTLDLCTEQLLIHNDAYVALSGGKDSGVLANVVCRAASRVNKNVKIWSHVSDASFPGTEETIKNISGQLGIVPDIYRCPFSAIETLAGTGERRKFGKSGVFYSSVREYARDKDLCFVGVRAAESKRRMRAARIHGQVFHSRSMGDIDTCYPLLWFRLEDIAAATVYYNIPLHPIYSRQSMDMGKNANGEDYFIRLGYITSRDLLDKGTAVFMKLNYPEIFSKLEKYYPDIRQSV